MSSHDPLLPSSTTTETCVLRARPISVRKSETSEKHQVWDDNSEGTEYQTVFFTTPF